MRRFAVLFLFLIFSTFLLYFFYHCREIDPHYRIIYRTPKLAQEGRADAESPAPARSAPEPPVDAEVSAAGVGGRCADVPEFSFRRHCALIFVKNFKVGGSTLGGVVRRIASRRGGFAEEFRTNHWVVPEALRTLGDGGQCDGLHMFANHKALFSMIDDFPGASERRRFFDRSFIISLVRHPLERHLSCLYYFVNAKPSLNQILGKSFARLQYSVFGMMRTTLDFEEDAEAIASYYDLLGTTERFDETLVALKMIMGLDFGDILYVKAKAIGTASTTAFQNGNIKSSQATPTPHPEDTALTVLQMEDLLAKYSFELDMWNIANRRLDCLVERLGAPFTAQLVYFRRLRRRVEEQCFGGNFNYTKSPTENCFWKDNGCANECLDQIEF